MGGCESFGSNAQKDIFVCTYRGSSTQPCEKRLRVHALQRKKKMIDDKKEKTQKPTKK
jgi:hypothetical protein